MLSRHGAIVIDEAVILTLFHNYSTMLPGVEGGKDLGDEFSGRCFNMELRQERGVMSIPIRSCDN